MLKPVTFYSEGVKLAGDLFLPADIKLGERRAGIVLCHGYAGVRSIYLPGNARGGDRGGATPRRALEGRVAVAGAARTLGGARPGGQGARLGIYGTSYGG